jgi:hypothetical protein
MLKIVKTKETSQLQSLHDPGKINGDYVKSISRGASKHFRIRKREYQKGKINELATNSKNENMRDLYRGRNELKMGCQPRNN